MSVLRLFFCFLLAALLTVDFCLAQKAAAPSGSEKAVSGRSDSEAGDMGAMNNLGLLLVDTDRAEAERWYRESPSVWRDGGPVMEIQSARRDPLGAAVERPDRRLGPFSVLRLLNESCL